MSRILNTDQSANIIRKFHYDDTNDQMTIETVQDVTDIIESNKTQYNAYTSLDRHGDLRKVASIPLAVLSDLRKNGILRDQKKLRAWLNDYDNRFFRTSPGVV